MEEAWWVEYIFGVSLAAKNNPESAPLARAISGVEAISLMRHIFSNCGLLFSSFTNEQVAEGLIFLGAAGESDWMYYVYDEWIDWPLRCGCIGAFSTLYRDCFATRCQDQEPKEICSLEGACYMWWDRFPSGGLAATSDAERPRVDQQLIGVMAEALELNHNGCRKSALHGLGHWQPADPERVGGIIDGWIARQQDVPESMLQYARAAREGNVQ